MTVEGYEPVYNIWHGVPFFFSPISFHVQEACTDYNYRYVMITQNATWPNCIEFDQFNQIITIVNTSSHYCNLDDVFAFKMKGILITNEVILTDTFNL